MEIVDVVYVDDEEENLEIFELVFRSSNFTYKLFQDPQNVLRYVQSGNKIKVLLSDQRMPVMQGSELFIRTNSIDSEIVNILITAYSDFNSLVEIVNKSKLFRFISKPWKKQELEFELRQAIEYYNIKEKNQSLLSDLAEKNRELDQKVSEIQALSEKLKQENEYHRKYDQILDDKLIIAESAAMKQIMKKARQISKVETTVLLTGETGTGKEVIARLIQANSSRVDQPFVKINCAAFSEDLLESELFGHEKGAFTGASSSKMGLFELANEGTIFLDELGELSDRAQSKLLRVLQDGEYRKVGGLRELKTNARIIAATNNDLKKKIEKGEFRKDLFYRLSVFPVHLPPLRERKEDIKPLTVQLVKRYARRMGFDIPEVSDKIYAIFCAYNWPGNIRELENVVERAVIITQGGKKLKLGDWLTNEGYSNDNAREEETLEVVERNHIIKVLKRVNWKVSGKNSASEILGMNASTLNSKLKKLNISKDDYLINTKP